MRSINLLLIDGLNLIRRIYAVQPDIEQSLQLVAQSLRRAIRDCQPTHGLMVLEGQGPNWRKQLYPSYKANRAEAPQALTDNLPRFITLCQDQGISSFQLDHYEADDVIASIACKAQVAGCKVIVLSTDKLFCQLISKEITIRDHFAKQNRDAQYVYEKFGVQIEQLVDYWALVGDSTNNIPGIKGVGPKTAKQLLNQYDSIKTITTQSIHPQSSAENKMISLLKASQQQLSLFQQLVELRTDVGLGVNLQDLRLI
ncbi:5'-3' exonuclease H3TH domain-containing protein [Spartinivicinus ruber]|uniref:5'-3' exonuclease H3TH domain-containing protein n=1 Tax=Spartinivicinus ruber TaxID=2683272 RepID=UPI0013CF7006|nr:5'-3' exonuclease H3TH domain-containing protein [Spartinivicinus ruber]